MAKDAGMIYRSFVDATRKLDDKTRLEAMDAYFDLLFDETEYEGDNPVVDALLTIMKPSLAKASNRYEAACENGKKGGAPVGNTNAKKQPENNQKTTRKQPELKKNNLTEAVAEAEADTEAVSSNEDVKADKRPARHKFGEFKHVLLSDQEYDKLIDDYGGDATLQAIRRVDEYCERMGKSYKNYNLVLRRWGFDAPPGNSAQGKAIRKLEEAWIRDL